MMMVSFFTTGAPCCAAILLYSILTQNGNGSIVNLNAALQQKGVVIMAVKARPVPPRARESSTVAMLSDWVRQGTESFFATQRILLDLVMRQNAKTVGIVREKFAAARTVPVEALTELTGEGISNFIAAQRVLLQLAQRQNEIVMTGLKDRAFGAAPLEAMTDLIRRGIGNFIDMQQHFLTIAAKQTDVWIDATKTGMPFEGKGIAELARESMETFVRSQKKFLDVVAEETAYATGEAGKPRPASKKTELTELAREGAEAFIDAQKKLLDVAAQQVDVSVKTARRTMEVINPLQPGTLADLTRQTVDGLVSAQKALLDLMAKPVRAAEARITIRRPKLAVRRRRARARRVPEVVITA
jgi:hypothetical protein